MLNNSKVISQNLVAAGLELTAADAIAEAVVTNVNTLTTKEDLIKMATKEDLEKLESATKADLESQIDKSENHLESQMDKMENRLERKIDEVRTEMKVLAAKVESLATSDKDIKNLIYGLYITLIVMFVSTLLG